MKVRQSCDRLVIVHVINKSLESYVCNTIPRSGAKSPRLCLVLAIPVQVVVAVIPVFYRVVIVLRRAAGVGVAVAECSSALAPGALFIEGAVEGRVVWLQLATQAADVGGPLGPVEEGDAIE